jgi:hypothetical protein
MGSWCVRSKDDDVTRPLFRVAPKDRGGRRLPPLLAAQRTRLHWGRIGGDLPKEKVQKAQFRGAHFTPILRGRSKRRLPELGQGSAVGAYLYCGCPWSTNDCCRSPRS